MTVLNTFDPRARITLYVCFTLAVLVSQSFVALGALVALGIALLLIARLSWQRVRSVAIGVAIFVAVISALNFLFRTPVEAAQQALRAVALASASLAIVLTFDPSQLGITFRKMGFPDRFAFTLDLTMRFVPTLMRDFRITRDAQRARGYELEATNDRSLRGLLRVGQRIAPLMVPVVVRAVLDAEDRANAMDLRAFGSGKRTWVQTLSLTVRDGLLVAGAFAMLAAAVAARLFA